MKIFFSISLGMTITFLLDIILTFIWPFNMAMLWIMAVLGFITAVLNIVGLAMLLKTKSKLDYLKELRNINTMLGGH